MTSKIEISGAVLKDYASSHKLCNFTQSECELAPKSSRLVLDLSNITNIEKVKLLVRRKSGNGSFQVTYGGNSFSFSVMQKKQQELSINGTGSIIGITRDKKSMGVISLIGVEVISKNEEQNLMPNWKSIIKRCGKYSNLRLIGGDLRASSGGFIEDKGRISHIETDPPQMFVREDQKINFVGSCKITRIDLKQAVGSPTNFLPNREAPSPNLTPSIPITPPPARTVPHNPPPIINNQNVETSDSIIFNSVSLKSFKKYFHNKNKTTKAVTGNGKMYLSVKAGGQASFTVSNLEGDKNYLVILTGKALSGNGRVYVNFAHQENDLSNFGEVTFTSGSTFSHKYISITSPSDKFGKMHRLNIHKPADMIGDVLIERMLIIENLDIDMAKNMVNSGHINNYLVRNNIKSITSKTVYVDSDDEVYKSSKIYARYERFIPSEKYSYNAQIDYATDSGALWSSKLLSVSDCKIAKDQNHGLLSVGNLGMQAHTSRIWLDYFDEGKKENLNSYDNKTIFTPSLSNKQSIEKFCPNSKVIHLAKPLPWIVPKKLPFFEKENYIVHFFRNKEATQRVLDHWKGSYGKLVVVGARGNLGDHVIAVNEYLSYDIFLGILLDSSGMIDVDIVNDKISGMQGLAKNLGLPVATNTWNISDDIHFIPSEEGLPSQSFLKEGIEKLKSSPKGELNINQIKTDFSAGCDLLFK